MPHIHDKIDFTVEVFIVYKNTVLLRRHDKLGIWLSVGGHIELDEDPNEAAVREVKEEVGLDIELDDRLKTVYEDSERYMELIPPISLNRIKVNENHEHITLVYFARAGSNKIKELSVREKSEACKWFSKEELQSDSMIVENVKKFALKALEVLGK